MNNLKFVKDKIIEAVPEIMELKFGCEILHKPSQKTFLYHSTTDKKDSYNLIADQPIFGSDWPITDLEILGRPIQLADVILAIQEKPYVVFVTLTKEGDLIVSFMEATPVHLAWNLSKDLSGQSPETIDFLYNLLK